MYCVSICICILLSFISRPSPLLHMYPPTPLDDTGLWCFAEDPGNDYVSLPPFPCRKEACPRYRAEFCVLSVIFILT